jgi:hypothetical protein
MTRKLISKSLHNMPVAERLELLEEIQLSLPDDDGTIPVYQWQKKMLDKRRAASLSNSSNTVSGSEFKAALRSAAQRFRQAARKKKV